MAEILVTAFGRRIVLFAPDDDLSSADALWRLKNLYNPYICVADGLPVDVALDIGAGFGTFCIPFAAAHPATTVYAFEPQEDIFDLLTRNIKQHALSNIIAIRAAVDAGPDQLPEDQAPSDEVPLTFCLGAAEKIRLASKRRRKFLRHVEKSFYLELQVDGGDTEPPEFEAFFADAMDVKELVKLHPGLVKITAPGQEDLIISALNQAPGIHFLCESWSYVRSISVYGVQPMQQARGLVRLAGSKLALRPQTKKGARKGLDIVVAAYNAKAYLVECVTSLLIPGREDIRVIVVDDGSTDGSGKTLDRVFGEDSRVRIVRKPNGGCASARNYGRLISDASHIAFVDADDVVSPEFFAHLLELSRYTGAEMVQGEFDFMATGDDGAIQFTPSYEDSLFADRPRSPFCNHEFIRVHRDVALGGQPTIWRRIYRRDFLDAKNIFFPEHIRAFDDQYFQMASVFHAGEIYTLLGHHYHYRQHAAQDIKQFDERHFYELEMFRLIAKRSVQEGWNDIAPILQSFVNTINWSLQGLRRDLILDFLKGAAELWVYLTKALGQRDLMNELLKEVQHQDFIHYVNAMKKTLSGSNDSFAWIYLDSSRFHPSMISMNKELC